MYDGFLRIVNSVKGLPCLWKAVLMEAICEG